MMMLTSWLVMVTLPAVIYSAGHMEKPDETLLEMMATYLKEEGGPGAVETLMKAQELMKHRDLDFGDLPEAQRMQVIREYMEAHMAQSGEEENMDKQMTDMLKHYIEQYNQGVSQFFSRHRQDFYAVGQAILDEEDIDEVSDLLIKAVENLRVITPSPIRRVIGAVTNHLRMDPGNERLQMMLLKAVEEATSDSEKLLVVNLFSYFLQMTEPGEPMAELAESVLEHLVEMTGELSTRKVPTIMLHHYVLQRTTMLEHIIYLTTNFLLNFAEPETLEMAGKLAYYVSSMRPSDIPEEERWKWEPPTMCRLMTNTGETINMTACPENAPCGLGPATVQISDGTYMVSLCEPPAELIPYHACQVTDKNGTVHYQRTCPDSECSLGPFAVLHEMDEWDITYCMSLLTPPSEHSMSDHACAMMNEKNYIMAGSQRMCPMGYKCDSGPIMMDDEHSAMMCREIPDPEFDHKIIDLLLGPLPEEEDESGEMDKMFMDFVASVIGDSHSRLEDNMDPDRVGLLILRHFIDGMEEMTGTRGLPGQVQEIFREKKSGSQFSDMDRELMQKMIMYFINKHQEMQQSSSSESESSEESSEEMPGGNPPMPGGNPPMPGGSPGGEPQGPDGSQELLLQLIRMYVQQQQRQPPPGPAPSPDMGDLAEALLNHVAHHQDLSETQRRHRQMIDDIRANLEEHSHSQEQDSSREYMGSQENDDFMEMLQNMMNARN